MPLRPLAKFLSALRPRPTTPGRRGEQRAAKHLKQHGYKILAKNLKNRFGEIDLIALAPDRKTIIIAEVKTAENENALPERRVNNQKQKRLINLAAQAVRRYQLQNHPIRFDVIAVNMPKNAKPMIRHYQGAFESHV